MSGIEELRNATAQMTAPALLRYLLEKFPNRCAITSSLRARSIVVLHMMAEIDRSAPVIFCHAPYIYPESAEYRARIVRLLGLTDVRDPEKDEATVLPPGDRDHYEEIRSGVWGGGTIGTIVHLNKSLAAFECWISAAYHRPYADDPAPRLIQEGRVLRVDPLHGWTQAEVYAYMAKRDLPHHPRIVAPTYHY